MADTGIVCEACNREMVVTKTESEVRATAKALWGDDWEKFPERRRMVCSECYVRLLAGETLVAGWRTCPRG